MSAKWRKWIHFKTLRLFYFWPFTFFFTIPISNINFLAAHRAPFFDIWSYMAGNCIFRIFERQKSNLVEIWPHFKTLRLFYFWLFTYYFSFLIPIINFLAAHRAHFFDFWSYKAGKFIFWCLKIPISVKIKVYC